MNNFKQRKIRTSPKRKLNEKTKNNIATGLGIILVILALYWGGLQVAAKLNLNRFLWIINGLFGVELKSDDKGRTNILLLGVGGVGHEGEDLTDTIIIASLNRRLNTASFLSIPRDMFIMTKEINGLRINELYSHGKTQFGDDKALDFTQKTTASILNIPIHYAAKIDFRAFEKIIDAIGGVDIYVNETINDPFYPREGTYEYELFYLGKGLRHLDGKTALKFARSRKTSSDFDRSKRQQQMIIAIKNRIVTKNSYSRNGLVKQLYYSLSEHIETDLSIREMLALLKMGTGLDNQSLTEANLNDDPFLRGGFLYTPPRELYEGAFVLVPAGKKYDSIQKFVELIFYGPKNISDFPIAILNGTKRNGLASRLKTILNRFGLSFSYTGNAQNSNLSSSIWYISDRKADPLVDFIQTLLPAEKSYQIPPIYATKPELANAKVILELGADSRPLIDDLDIFRNVITNFIQNGSSSSAGTTSGAAATLTTQ